MPVLVRGRVIGIHTILREATRAAHARVDAHFPHGLADADAYAVYLRGMHAFACGLDAALAAARLSPRWQDWRVSARGDWLADDLRALGLAPLPARPAPALHGDAAGAGALYVVEGAALGARLLLEGARGLGYDADRGARFLHRHADGDAGRRWPRFLHALDDAFAGADPHASCAAARAVFGFADACFSTAIVHPATA